VFHKGTTLVLQRPIGFIQKSGGGPGMGGLVQGAIGTQLYERLRSEGRVVENTSGDNVDGTTNIVPKMNLEMLTEGYHSILRHIYSPRAYYERVRTFLKEYQAPKVETIIDKEQVLALFRSIYRLGIRGAERTHYWRLFFWTLLHRPRLFPHAITLAIYGYHFRRVCERVAA